MDTSAATVIGLAFAIGFAFGAVSQATRFCTMGAVADIVAMGDWDRMRMWLLAIGVAVLGTGGLDGLGLVDLEKSLYRAHTLPWLSQMAGGICFGTGMVLASGCGARTLVRIGGGNLKSLVVFLVMGIAAAITLRGVLGVFRAGVLDPVAITLPAGQDLPALLGIPRWLALLALGGGPMAFALGKAEFRRPAQVLGGAGIGLAVVAAWYVSGHLAHLPEDPETLQEAWIATSGNRPEALSFVAPAAYFLDLLMLWSDASRKLNFPIAAILGVVTGAFALAIITRTFRWEGFADAADTARHLIGAVLMGFGGVTALGCTIGQGISGLATLSPGSLLTIAAIVFGAWTTLKIEWRLLSRKA